MSMFQILKREVPLRQGIEHYTGAKLTSCGSRNSQLEDTSCPFCGHNDCFKCLSDEDQDILVHFRCYSCGRQGSDTVAFYMELHNAKPENRAKSIEAIYAAKQVAKDFDVPWQDFAAVQQEILDVTARFYHYCLTGNSDRIIVDGYDNLNPLKYQTEYRKHSLEALDEFEVGWATKSNSLQDYLEGLGYSVEDCISAGVLVEHKDEKTKKTKVNPLFWPGVFIYPHFVDGKVSHFTQKSPDPLKPSKHQMKAEHSRNGYMVYGQDDVKHARQVFVVEGENDRISLWEHLKGKAAVIALIGQPSKKQCDWIAANLRDKDVYTIFDNDDAGDKYRTVFQGLSLARLKQFKVPGKWKDIDEYLKKDPAAELERLVPAVIKLDTENARTPEDGKDGTGSLRGVFEEGNCYYRLSIDRKGNAEPVKVSNFTMRLQRVYVYEKDDTREREVIIVKEDGTEAPVPLLVDSLVKTRLQDFRKAIADVADVAFYGGDQDLHAVWDAVYNKQEGKVIRVPMEIGHQYNGGWVFRDCYIDPKGEVFPATRDGLIPVHDEYLFPMGVTIQTNARRKHRQRHGIPSLIIPYDKTEAEHEAFFQEFCHHFIRNIGDVGMAVCMLAWAKACAFSHQVFEHYRFFPFLYLWGRFGKGKSTVSYWLLNLYGMRGISENSLSRLESGVGFNRMMATYSSLPVLLEEMRANKEASDLHGTIRSWYNRVPRPMGDRRDASVIVSQPVRACLMFNGEDVLTDPAARSRCIEFQFPPEEKRDLDVSYTWIEGHAEELPSIGLRWIRESLTTDYEALFADMKRVERMLLAGATKDRRVAQQWSLIGVFADHLFSDLGLDPVQYSLEAFLIAACKGRSEDIREENIVTQFFQMVEGIQVQKNSPIMVGEHLRVAGDQIFLWVPELWQICQREREALRNSATTFSSKALLNSLRGEPYYQDTAARKMGMSGTNRKVVILRLEEGIPDSLKAIAALAEAE